MKLKKLKEKVMTQDERDAVVNDMLANPDKIREEFFAEKRKEGFTDEEITSAWGIVTQTFGL